DIAQSAVDRQIRREIDIHAGVQRGVAIAVLLIAEIGNIEAVAAPESARQREIVIFPAARQGDPAEEGAIRSAFRPGIDAPAVATTALGDDVDDAGRGVGAPKGALRSAQDFDAIY